MAVDELFVVPRFARQQESRSGRYEPHSNPSGSYLPDRDSSRRPPQAGGATNGSHRPSTSAISLSLRISEGSSVFDVFAAWQVSRCAMALARQARERPSRRTQRLPV